ncbi:hypothetical protein C8R43DRAFT_1136166 [Mycena crocata]|nr:hypothetical protein C8R43DRAFT_1136166 [Mycena crocata]
MTSLPTSTSAAEAKRRSSPPPPPPSPPPLNLGTLLWLRLDLIRPPHTLAADRSLHVPRKSIDSTVFLAEIRWSLESAGGVGRNNTHPFLSILQSCAVHRWGEPPACDDHFREVWRATLKCRHPELADGEHYALLRTPRSLLFVAALPLVSSRSVSEASFPGAAAAALRFQFSADVKKESVVQGAHCCSRDIHTIHPSIPSSILIVSSPETSPFSPQAASRGSSVVAVFLPSGVRPSLIGHVGILHVQIAGGP